MRLLFVEQGAEVGVVTLVHGRLEGPPVWQRMVSDHARRDGLSLAEAMHALDGWSNGYLTAELDGGPADGPAAHHRHQDQTGHQHGPRAETPDPPEDPDLAELDAAYQRALDDLMRRWPDITAAQREQIRRQIEAAVNSGDLQQLADLEVDTGESSQALLEVMLALAIVAAVLAVREGKAQGVALTAASATELGLEGAAQLAADLIAADMTLTAGREAARVALPGRSGAEVADDVDTVLLERSDTAARAQAGGALHGSVNAGRVQTFASGPVGSLYADERLDSRTCGPCRAINGRFICTTEDLGPYNRLYTKLGGYKDCLGGIRCRGVITGVWRPETTEEFKRAQQGN